MTTNAECAAVSAVTSKHGGIAQKAGTDGPMLAQAGQVLAGLGAGLPASSAPTDVCNSGKNATASAANRAAANGNYAEAAQLRTASGIFTQLAAGL